MKFTAAQTQSFAQAAFAQKDGVQSGGGRRGRRGIPCRADGMEFTAAQTHVHVCAQAAVAHKGTTLRCKTGVKFGCGVLNCAG
jgi:hypothetical protein